MNRHIFRVALAIVLALSTSPAQAGLNQWTTNGPNDAAIINSIAVDPTSPLTVYAASSKTTPLDGKVFKSTNGGGSWNPMTNGLPGNSVDIIVVDPANTNTLYVGTFGGGVLKSTNGGGTWQPMNTGLVAQAVLALAIDPLNTNIIFAGTASGLANAVFRSTNGGGNWSPVGTGLPNGITNTIAIDPANPQVVYAGTQSGFFKSTNGGGSGSWVEMDNGFTPDPSPGILAIAINPQNTNIVYVGTGGFGVWKSVNGGGNWTAMNNGLTDFLVNGLVLDPQRPNVLYAATSGGFFRSIDGGASWTKFGVGQPPNVPNVVKSVAISQTGTCLHFGTNVNGATGQVFDYSMVVTCGPLPPAVPPLAAAVLPSSRSVHVGTPATAFVTLINSGTSTAVAPWIAKPPGFPADFSFQTTNPSTNQPIGTPNVPVDIPVGQAQTYVISLDPTTALAPSEVAFVYQAENTTGPTPILPGVNTLLLSSSFSPIPDIVALALTLTNDGIVHIPGSSGANAFAVASVNVGAAANITVSADTGSVTLPLSLFVCQTNASGQCLGSPQPSVTVQIAANATPTFSIFATATGTIVFDPATNRIFVRFKDPGNVTRGSTSVAVTTQ
jgi:photosystem II stability/assembly factor-like uncharacterized protein